MSEIEPFLGLDYYSRTMFRWESTRIRLRVIIFFSIAPWIPFVGIPTPQLRTPAARTSVPTLVRAPSASHAPRASFPLVSPLLALHAHPASAGARRSARRSPSPSARTSASFSLNASPRSPSSSAVGVAATSQVLSTYCQLSVGGYVRHGVYERRKSEVPTLVLGSH